jgi:hypothetical protein
MGNKNPYSVQHIAPGIILEYSSDRTLLIFNVENSSPITLDAWTNYVKSVLESWPSHTPCLLLYDLHKLGRLDLNNSLYEHFETLYQSALHLKRYTAVVIPNNTSIEETQLRIALQRLHVPLSYPAQWKVFTSRQEAMRWLLVHEGSFRQEMSS